MPGKLARRTLNLVRKTRGMFGRVPRVLNRDKGTLDGNGVPLGVEIIGFTEVNKNATTPFSRGKVHKGFLCCDRANISNGDLLYDRAEDAHFFVMDSKVEVYNGEDVYIDATLYRCDALVDVVRFSDGVRDTFGRIVQDAPQVVATQVNAMFNPKNYDSISQEDRQIAHNKIQVCVQDSVGVAVSDRIISGDKKYVVQAIDDVSLTGLVLCNVDTDVR